VKGQGKLNNEHLYHFQKYADAVCQNNIKISPCLSKLELSEVGAFFETQCIFSEILDLKGFAVAEVSDFASACFATDSNHDRADS